MVKNRLITPEGTKDYLFEEAMVRNNIEHKLRQLYEHHGFYEVVTPSLEFLDVFQVEGHSIPLEYMYKLTDHKGRLMVLRPDSTMPIARLMATRLKGAKLPLRLYYNQAVHFTTRSMSGRSDEIMQAGIELIGQSSLKADLEVISTAIQSFVQCNQHTFRIEIGHIGIFNTLMNSLHIPEEIKEEIRLLIESKNYPALNDLLDKLGNQYEVSVIKQLPRLFGGKEVFKKAASLINDNATIEILNYLETIYDNLLELNLQDKITVDLGIVNRADYYTGVVFKGYIEGHGEEVLSGGRYDSLLSKFGEDMGAIGFAINIDAVAKASINERKPIIPIAKVIVYAEEGYEMKGIRYLEQISKDIKCEYSIFETLEETIIYAKERCINRIDIVSDQIKTIEI
ncbi:ATP phosphoribosyltransferase regulatory subunit [Paludicola sp. MB14-C6]|uniref:ATP phosphoribosyltransferase regulatory subunit n=1 Tax=Paludihabitans sp. MB14-C6 TaxID=3070656 RepID=UPI0027DD6CBA|nr:ATP phosphoribosyltransferase regulatory subunit [Paludicola sp. MB14-C6]WMJ23637.1 ATP phosphoribosyltransferase regulatory subunit [Paludicola sp. MB14-C6]